MIRPILERVFNLRCRLGELLFRWSLVILPISTEARLRAFRWFEGCRPRREISPETSHLAGSVRALHLRRLYERYAAYAEITGAGQLLGFDAWVRERKTLTARPVNYIRTRDRSRRYLLRESAASWPAA